MDFQAFLNKFGDASWVIYPQSQMRLTIAHVKKIEIAIDKKGTQLVLKLVGDNKKITLTKDDQLAFLKGEDVSRILDNEEPVLKEIFSDSKISVKHTHTDQEFYSHYREVSVGIGMIWVGNHDLVYDFTEEKVLSLSQNHSVNNVQIEYMHVPLKGITEVNTLKKSFKKLFEVKYLSLLEHFNG